MLILQKQKKDELINFVCFVANLETLVFYVAIAKK